MSALSGHPQISRISLARFSIFSPSPPCAKRYNILKNKKTLIVGISRNSKTFDVLKAIGPMRRYYMLPRIRITEVVDLNSYSSAYLFYNTIEYNTSYFLSSSVITGITASEVTTHGGIEIRILLSRRSRQRQRLSASMLSICSSVCLSVWCQNAKNAIFSKIKQFRAMVAIDDL